MEFMQPTGACQREALELRRRARRGQVMVVVYMPQTQEWDIRHNHSLQLSAIIRGVSGYKQVSYGGIQPAFDAIQGS